jgi:hypothetical protein
MRKKPNLITIELTEESSYIARIRRGSQIRFAQIADLARVLGSVNEADRDAYTWVDLLASERLAIGIQNEKRVFIISQPPTTYHARYPSQMNIHKPLNYPGTTYVLSFEGTRFLKMRIFVSHGRLGGLGHDLALTPFPYGNCYGPGSPADKLPGEVCWGTANTRSITPNNPRGAIRLFWESGFNGDLLLPVTDRSGGNMLLDAWFKEKVETEGSLDLPICATIRTTTIQEAITL